MLRLMTGPKDPGVSAWADQAAAAMGFRTHTLI